MRKAVFLDRDGIINRKAPEGEYVIRQEDFVLLPGVADSIRLLNQAQFAVVVVTNQRCVAKGLLSSEALECIHHHMVDRLLGLGARIDSVYYCPHESDSGCTCRKPAPGMILRAAEDHFLDLGQSWMIGDSDSDVQAGKNAGCKTVRVIRDGVTPQVEADLTVSSLPAAVAAILRT